MIEFVYFIQDGTYVDTLLYLIEFILVVAGVLGWDLESESVSLQEGALNLDHLV